MKIHLSGDRKKLLIVFLLCLSASASIVYFPITKYDLYDSATGGKHGDVSQYVKMYQGIPLSNIRKPFCYRILTPFLARLVPSVPDSIGQFYEITPEKIIQLKFGIINLLGLAITSFLLFVFCGSLSFSDNESLFGSYLFLTSFFVVNYGGVPLVDALAYCFLLLGILSAMKNWQTLLFFSSALGMFAKETTALLPLWILLLPDSMASRFRKVLLCLPGIVLYLVVRFALFPTDFGYHYGFHAAVQSLKLTLIPSAYWLYYAFDGGLSFGLLWVLGLHGWILIRREKNNPLYRLSFIVPVILVIPFFIFSNIGRIWFLAFPVVIPLSLLSLRSIFRPHTIGTYDSSESSGSSQE